MEWIVAVVAFALVCALVIGVPLYLGMTRWSSRADRKAAEARRRASAASYTEAVTPRPDPQRSRRALNP
ncbi:hypothetical protein GCM10023200_55650 [Actinomycetospora chlora]|uniref:Uncharacterized protein n=1 Tax=Actinomycetospora chlora TaxID=663608 RepID=A0ABP9CJQ7_9PSEU